MALHRNGEPLDHRHGAGAERQKKIARRLEKKRLGERVGHDVREEREDHHALKVRRAGAKRIKDRYETDMLDRRIGQKALEVVLTDHEHGADGDREDAEREHRIVAERRGLGGRNFAEAHNRKERTVQKRAREKRGNGGRSLGVGVGEP